MPIDNPSDTEEKFGKQIDKRILVNKRKLETVRLKLAKAINSAASANKMEKEKYIMCSIYIAPFYQGQPLLKGAL